MSWQTEQSSRATNGMSEINNNNMKLSRQVNAVPYSCAVGHGKVGWICVTKVAS